MIPPTSKTILDSPEPATPEGPMRPEQARRLQILCAELLEAYDESLNQAQAEDRIEALERLKQERKDRT